MNGHTPKHCKETTMYFVPTPRAPYCQECDNRNTRDAPVLRATGMILLTPPTSGEAMQPCCSGDFEATNRTC